MTHGPPSPRRPTTDGPAGSSSAGRPRPSFRPAAVLPPAPEETHVHCTRCGHQNPEGSRFCAQCGAALAQERVGESTSVIPKVGGEDSGDQPEVTDPATDAHAG